ncbi:MAG: 50S ribosomal protein L18 [Thaumarchaeota archaeon]|nr:50S ribosomal protein L18 [Nitrososphaerota archaeon]
MEGHVPLQRRRRQGVTDYRARKKVISSKVPLLVVRVSNKNVSAQFVRPQVNGDIVLASAHSRQLRKFGWRGSLNSTPASYLLGTLAGRGALSKGVKEAIVYNGLAPFVSGARVSAFVKGVVDAGIKVPVGEEVLPSGDRISGRSIADFAAKLAAEDKDSYSRRFSGLLKGGFRPEEYPQEFEKTKAAIVGSKK